MHRIKQLFGVKLTLRDYDGQVAEEGMPESVRIASICDQLQVRSPGI